MEFHGWKCNGKYIWLFCHIFLLTLFYGIPLIGKIQVDFVVIDENLNEIINWI